MKYLFALLIVAAVCSTAFAGDCEFKGQSLKVGETYTPIGECNIYECHSNGGVTAKTCPVVHSTEPCTEKQDLTKPYPECCSKC